MSAPASWVNGVLGGTVDPRDRGFTLGDGVFDTLVAYAGRPFAGERHLVRLGEHAAAIGIAVDPAVVHSGWEAVLSAAGAATVVLRTAVTRGIAARGLWPSSPTEPTIVVSAEPWSAALVGGAVRLVTAALRRNPAALTTRVKTLSYLDNILGAREAAGAGADDALLLADAGHVACTTIANIFVVSGNRLRTPPLADGVIAGITRALVLELAAHAGLVAEERTLLPADLDAADAVFTTNSVRLIRTATALDGRPLAARAAPAVAALRAALAREIRRECGFDVPAS
jgi:branched-chain amino acid aminotransferase